MKLKYQFIITEIADDFIATPVGDGGIYFNSIIKLNETAAVIFEQLNNEITYDALVSKIVEKFGCDLDYAKENVDAIIKSLKENDLITE